MRLLPLACLAAVLAAGCLSHANAPAASTAPAAAPFWTQIALPGDNAGSEPNLALAPDGHLYVVAPGEQYTHVWRGEPGARNWTDLGLVAKDTNTNDADVTVRPDGSVWVATMWSNVPKAPVTSAAKCTEVSVSRDQGKTWADNDLGCGASPFFDERPWLAADGKATYLLHYQSAVQGVEPTDVGYGLTASADGAQWDWTYATGVPSGFASRLVPHGDGVAFANFQSTSNGYTGPTLTTTTDGGLTWTQQAIASERNDMRTPGLAFTGDRGVATWITLGPHGSTLRASFLAGSAWGAPVTLDGNGTNAMAWADGANGHLVVSWLHTDAGAHPCKVPDGAAWRLRVWQDGTVREVPTPIHSGALFDVIGGREQCSDAHGRALGDYISVAALPDGTAVVATPVSEPGGKFPSAPVHVFVVPPPA